jgi:stage III sporulation protein AH
MSTETLTFGAILTALVVILQFLAIGVRAVMPFLPFTVSLVLIPIVIGAAKGGPYMGAWLGFVFGVIVLLSGDAAAIASGEDPLTTASDYFAAVRLSRQQARDSAVNMLQEAMAYADSTKAAESSQELEDIVQTALSEASIESLVIAKGYTDCVAYMTNEGISVAVAAPEGGLKQEDVAVIADIVMSQSAYTLSDIGIVEVQ